MPLFGRKNEDPVTDPDEPARGTAPAPTGDGMAGFDQQLRDTVGAHMAESGADPGRSITEQDGARYQLPDGFTPGPADLTPPLSSFPDGDDRVAPSDGARSGRSSTDPSGWSLTGGEPEPDGDPLAVTGSHALPEEDTTLGYRVACETCDGRGYHMVSVTTLLGEVVALIPEGGGDVFVKEFYTQLMLAAPYLADLFPADLLGADTLKGQREKLWNALAELFTRYRPTDAEAMAALDTALAAWGRLHANFARSDGTIRGATAEEYQAVKSILLATLRQVAGDRWNEVYDAAVGEAYDYAWSGMWFSQLRTEMTMPRYPRTTGTVK